MTISRTICLGFLGVILAGAFLLTLPISGTSGTWNSPLVALFTSTSAVCVTGLAVVDTGTYFSFWGQLFIVLLIQIGGLGYMTMTTFFMLLLRRKFNLRQKLAIKDSFDRPFLQGSQNLITSILATTLLFELAGGIILYLVFSAKYSPIQSLWFAIFHSVSAWNNAGFGLLKDNLVSYQTSIPVNFAISGLIIFGGIGYQVIIEAYFWLRTKIKNNKEQFNLSLNFKVATSTTIFLLLFGTIVFFFSELDNPSTMQSLSIPDKLIASWFQSVTSRTAGFNSIDIGKMTTTAIITTMGLMFIGACPSGTGGGIKTTTIRIINSCTRSVLQGKAQVLLYQREVPISLVLRAVAVVFGSAMTVLISTFMIEIIDTQFDAIPVLFEVISAFATVGLSMGITASLNPAAQIILILTMYIGRVGILLLMTALEGDPNPSAINYPSENLLVG